MYINSYTGVHFLGANMVKWQTASINSNFGIAMLYTHHKLGNDSLFGWPKERTAKASSGYEIASIAKPISNNRIRLNASCV